MGNGHPGFLRARVQGQEAELTRADRCRKLRSARDDIFSRKSPLCGPSRRLFSLWAMTTDCGNCFSPYDGALSLRRDGHETFQSPPARTSVAGTSPPLYFSSFALRSDQGSAREAAEMFETRPPESPANRSSATPSADDPISLRDLSEVPTRDHDGPVQ